ncbi:MAG: hypothetical protein ABSH08_16075 [Tepidisphaeraceae bacterium]
MRLSMPSVTASDKSLSEVYLMRLDALSRHFWMAIIRPEQFAATRGKYDADDRGYGSWRGGSAAASLQAGDGGRRRYMPGL